MLTQSEIHNAIVGRVVETIVRPPLAAGGGFTDVLVILESVIVGVILVCVRLGGDEIVLDEVVKNAKARIAKKRLSDIKPDGTA